MKTVGAFEQLLSINRDTGLNQRAKNRHARRAHRMPALAKHMDN